jgi:glycosyltransferase involved in cell wall biosynthesis
MKKSKLFVEAVPLVDKQVSGVPHALAGLVAALAANPQVQQQFEIVLVTPGSRMHLLDRWPGLQHCTRKPIPMKFRIMNGLGRRGLLPPMDLLLGRGVYLFGNFFNWPLTRLSRSFTYMHDVCFAVYPQYVQPENQRMLAKNVPRFIKQTNYIITVSQSSKKEIIEHFDIDPQKVLVLYNGVNTELYKPYPADEVAKVKQKYGLKDKKYLLYIGNIEPRKNLERLVNAMTRLPKECTLIMVGSDGWLNEAVFAAIKKANKQGHTIIKPKNYVDDNDVARLLSGAKALVLPSLHEGFGMPALEALVSHTPAVVADIPPLHEVTGKAGIYCDPHDVDSIASAMMRALQFTKKERAAVVTQGLEQAKQFTWQRSAQVLAEALQHTQREIK